MSKPIYTIIIPHYKTGKMTAYCLWRIFQHSKGRMLKIVVVDNSNGEGRDEISAISMAMENNTFLTYLVYPKDKMQSHGIAIDYALQYGSVDDHFIVLESDSFPVQDGWLDWYDQVVANDGSCTGSVLQLSGGRYLHPAGSLYRKKDWQGALEYVTAEFLSSPIGFGYGSYRYFPNMAMKEGFPCHLMIRKDVLADMKSPQDHEIELHSSYQGLDADGIAQKALDYLPISEGVFHNGIGAAQEAFSTYRFRDMMTYCHDTIFRGDEEPIIYRMGYEPGQWFSYWLNAMGKPIFEIPTKTVWMQGRENQQQEYTLTVNGVKHLWGMTAYNGQKIDGLEDITQHKNSLLDDLYGSIPDRYKPAK